MRYNFEAMEQARQEKTMEFTELAYRSGVSEPHIRQILSGAKGCSEKLMWRIADVLDVSPKTLGGESEKKKKKKKKR